MTETTTAELLDQTVSLNGDGKPRNVIEALARVRVDLPGIGKDQEMNDGGQRWKYRGIEDVTAALGPILGRYGVVFVPKLLTSEPHEFTTRSGSVWIEWRCLIAYTIYGPGGRDDCIEAGPVFALARDASDKGLQKVMTSAYKQVLNQVFCIGDSADDIDKSNPQREADVAPPRGSADRPPADSHPVAQPPDPDAKAREAGWASRSERDAWGQMLAEAVKARPAEAAAQMRAWREHSGASATTRIGWAETVQVMRWLDTHPDATLDDLDNASVLEVDMPGTEAHARRMIEGDWPCRTCGVFAGSHDKAAHAAEEPAAGPVRSEVPKADPERAKRARAALAEAEKVAKGEVPVPEPTTAENATQGAHKGVCREPGCGQPEDSPGSAWCQDHMPF